MLAQPRAAEEAAQKLHKPKHGTYPSRYVLSSVFALLVADGIISTGTGDASVARGCLLRLILRYTRTPVTTDNTTAPATAPRMAPMGNLSLPP